MMLIFEGNFHGGESGYDPGWELLITGMQEAHARADLRSDNASKLGKDLLRKLKPISSTYTSVEVDSESLRFEVADDLSDTDGLARLIEIVSQTRRAYLAEIDRKRRRGDYGEAEQRAARVHSP